jgi:hypothetical protein
VPRKLTVRVRDSAMGNLLGCSDSTVKYRSG